MNENICPICQTKNKCMAHNEKPCWCNNVKIPQKLIDLVPENQQTKSCICLSCIEKYNAAEAEEKAK